MYLVEFFMNNTLIECTEVSDFTIEQSYGEEFLDGGEFIDEDGNKHIVTKLG